jgi:uncharacterized OsmC-like protein
MAEQQANNMMNGIDLDTLQSTINAIKDDPELAKCRFHVCNKWIDGNHNRTTVSSFYGAKEERRHKHSFDLDCDEPTLLAGHDSAANPVEHLLNSLAGCITTGMVAHAAVRGIRIEELESQVEGDLDLRGFLGLSEDVPRGYTNIRVRIKVRTDVENIKKLRQLVEYSPILCTLIEGTKVDVNVEPK